MLVESAADKGLDAVLEDLRRHCGGTIGDDVVLVMVEFDEAEGSLLFRYGGLRDLSRRCRNHSRYSWPSADVSGYIPYERMARQGGR